MATEKQRLTFISYSRGDKEFALALAKELRSSGFLIWLDQLDIPAGARWDDEVERALTESEIFMVILTSKSTASNNVKDEIGFAIDNSKRILPVLLENVNVPLRLRRFQYVDFTNMPYKQGIEMAKELLRRLLNESTGPNQAIAVEDLSQEAKKRSESKIPSPTDAERLARQRADAVRAAREREQLDRQSQQAQSAQPTNNRTPIQQKQPGASMSKLISIIIGASFLLVLCLGGGYFMYNLITTNPTPTVEKVSHYTLTPVVTVLPISIVAVDSPTEIPTFTPTPTVIPTITVTPFSPQEPDRFIIFFFDTVIYRREYELAWSLLMETFREKNDLKSFNDWKSTWEMVKEWKEPEFSVTYLTETKVIVSAPEIWFRASKWYSLKNLNYCLVRDESRNTWMIETKSACGL